MKLKTYLFFLTMLVAGCKQHNDTPEAGLLNVQASLPKDFNFKSLQLKMVTSTVNKKLSTMSVLYGNEVTKVAALVTWRQQPDKRWIGGNIPGELLSVEMLKPAPDAKEMYTKFTGAELALVTDTISRRTRINFIRSLRPSVLF